SPGRPRAVPTSTLSSSGAVRPGRASTTIAASPATAAAAALVPSTSTKRDEPSGVSPGSTVTTPTPGPATPGFGSPPSPNPQDEKRGTRGRPGVLTRRAGATESPTATRASRARP